MRGSLCSGSAGKSVESPLMNLPISFRDHPSGESRHGAHQLWAGLHLGSSLEVSSPTAFSPLEAAALMNRDASPARRASPGSLNLLTPSSASSLPIIFQTGSALGVEPSKAFLLPCSRTPSPAPSALMTLTSGPIGLDRRPQAVALA